MAKFIEIKISKELKYLVNTEFIESVEEDKGKAVITFSTDFKLAKKHTVSQTYEEIKKALV